MHAIDITVDGIPLEIAPGLALSGVTIWGRAEVHRDGSLGAIWLEHATGRPLPYYELPETSPIYGMIAASIAHACAGQIADAAADLRDSALAREAA